MQSQISAYNRLFFLDFPSNVQYALLVLLDLAHQQSVSINDMATKYFIAKPDLEAICLNLQQGGLIDSYFDTESYALKHQPCQITLLDVAKVMKNQSSQASTLDAYTPERKLIHKIWEEANTAAQNKLRQYTLQDLCKQQNTYKSFS